MRMTYPPAGAILSLVCSGLLALSVASASASSHPDLSASSGRDLGPAIVLSWNDLGMHCMNQYHVNLSVLPPYNTLYAQVIQRGDAENPPVILVSGVGVEYSIPGNTYSVGKTDFWDYVFELFGVQLPDDVGLTGKGLSGEMDPAGDHFVAEGIPITPFPDATPSESHPYQQALLVARDGLGSELASSRPTIPVSVEMYCVSSGCHASETQILYMHENEAGYNPADTPILCASCHADPALGTPGLPEAGYFSEAIHKAHTFIDQQIPGLDGCQKCHPGPETQCLRGTMANDYGMICQDCHGTIQQVSQSIDDGRIPWVEEPSCRECHTPTYGEPEGQLFRNSRGHGGIFCAACHHSPHAIYPSREAADNANMVELQGHAGILSDCTVCHGVTPAGPGPHGYTPSGVPEDVLPANGPGGILAAPNPASVECTLRWKAASSEGRLLIFDAQGRTIRLLRASREAPGALSVTWDGRTGTGLEAPPGVYYAEWRGAGGERSTGRLVRIP